MTAGSGGSGVLAPVMLVCLSQRVVCEVDAGESVDWRRYRRDISVSVHRVQDNFTTEELISSLTLWQSSNI